MRGAARLPGRVSEYDPELSDVDVGPAKNGSLRPRPFPMRTRALFFVLAVIWAGLLLDPQIGPFILSFAGAIGITLVIVAMAMGLGMLGFGFAAASGWMAGQIRRAGRWPDE